MKVSEILRDLKISPAAEFFRTPLIVIDRAEKEVVEQSPMTSLRDLMRNFLPANKYNDAIALVGQLVRNNECDKNENGFKLDSDNPISLYIIT